MTTIKAGDNIQAGIDASSGDVVFAAGDYGVIPQITLRGKRRYIFADNFVSQFTAKLGFYCFALDTASPDGITIVNGPRTVGSALRIEKQGGWVQNLNIGGWKLDGAPTAENSGISWTNGLKDSVIARVMGSFRSANGFIHGVSWDGRVEVRDCVLGSPASDWIDEGMHFVADAGASTGLWVHDCQVWWHRRLGIEIQGTGKCVKTNLATGACDVLVERNLISHAWITKVFSENEDAFSISMPFQGGTSICRDNNIDCPERSDGTGDRVGIELASTLKYGGEDGTSHCYHNRINGVNNAVAVAWSNGFHIYENLVTNCLSGVTRESGPHSGDNWLVNNNGPTVKLPWDYNKWPIVVDSTGDWWAAPDPTPTPPGPVMSSTYTVINGQAALNGVVDTSSSGVIQVYADGTEWRQVVKGKNGKCQVWTLPASNARLITEFDLPVVTTPPVPNPIVSLSAAFKNGDVVTLKQ